MLNQVYTQKEIFKLRYKVKNRNSDKRLSIKSNKLLFFKLMESIKKKSKRKTNISIFFKNKGYKGKKNENESDEV